MSFDHEIIQGKFRHLTQLSLSTIVKTSKPGRLECKVDPCGDRAFRERILTPNSSP